MADLAVIQLCPSKGHLLVGDCGVCALSTVSGLAYEDVVAVAVQHVGEGWKKGLYSTHMIAIAHDIGVHLKRRRKYDLETDTGILTCDVTIKDGDRMREVAHYVVLMNGLVFDSDLRCWAHDAFKQQYQAVYKTLLEVV